MQTEIKVEEVKQVVFKRVPPGDRWSPVEDTSIVLNSLTEALEYRFQKTGQTDFFLAAREGTISVIDTKEVEVEKPVQKYSLYGEY